MTEKYLDVIDVCRMLRQACDNAGGQKAWAEAHGVSEAYVSKVLHASREPGKAILDALGLTMRVVYRKRERTV